MDSPRSLGVVGVLSEALFLTSRNKKLMLPCLMLALIPSSLLLVGNHVSIYPLLVDFIMKLHSLGREYPTTPQFYDILVRLKNDASAMSQVSVSLIVASYFASLLSTVIIVHASSAAFSGRHFSVKDLLLKVKGSSKGAFVTFLYSTLLSVGYAVLSVSLIAIPVLNMNGQVRFIAPTVAVATVARLFYIYLAMLWMLGVVIAILEDGCNGLEALQKAGELVTGRRTKGFLIALVLLLGEAVVTGGHTFGRTNQIWRELIVCVLYLLLKMFSPMVYTLFYHECKKGHGDAQVREAQTKLDHDASVDGIV